MICRNIAVACLHFQLKGARRTQGCQMDMFSLCSLGEDGKKDKQVKKRRTEVLAVGIAEDDDGANAEDERGEVDETCSENLR